MTRILTTAAAFAALIAPAIASADTAEMAGMKSELPEGWKSEKPENSMRLAQFTVPAAKGDSKGAEVVIFRFPGGSGTVEQNFERQQAKFEASEGKLDVTTSKTKVGSIDAEVQDIKGTYLEKFPPFAPNAKITKRADYRQLYVAFKGQGGDYYVVLLGPEKTVSENKEAFETWLKNFK